jgi:hypothetical protein
MREDRLMVGDADYLSGLSPELDALRAHTAIDRAESIDHGWATKAKTLHTRLVPPGLDPDPLATVERLVTAQKAAEEKDNEAS